MTLSVWGYQTWGEGSEGGTTPDLSAETRTAPLESADGAVRAANGAGAPRAASPLAARSNIANEDLPVMQTDELPRAPDDQGEEEEGSVRLLEGGAGVTVRGAAAGSSAGGRHANPAEPASVEPKRVDARLDPARVVAAAAKPAVPSRAVPSRAVPSRAVPARAVPSRAVPRREPPRKSTKPVNSADCNPPYFFDSNNIRRLKLECL